MNNMNYTIYSSGGDASKKLEVSLDRLHRRVNLQTKMAFAGITKFTVETESGKFYVKPDHSRIALKTWIHVCPPKDDTDAIEFFSDKCYSTRTEAANAIKEYTKNENS